MIFKYVQHSTKWSIGSLRGWLISQVGHRMEWWGTDPRQSVTKVSFTKNSSAQFQAIFLQWKGVCPEMQYTPKLNIHGETPEKTLDLHGFTWILYVWHSRKIRRSIVARGTAPRTQPLRRRFSFKPRKRLDVWAWSSQPPSMENIKGPVQLRSCTHGWPQAVSARRESWNRPNRGEDVNGNIGTTESKTTISFDNLQNTPWFDNTSWMNQ
jgi:hypothetical protein